MSVRRRDGLATRRRSLDARIMARVSPLPPPEEVFIGWLMSVPMRDCLEAAARYQIEIIDRSAAVMHPDVRRLRTLLAAVSGGGDWPKPVSNS